MDELLIGYDSQITIFVIYSARTNYVSICICIYVYVSMYICIDMCVGLYVCIHVSIIFVTINIVTELFMLYLVLLIFL